MGDPAGIEHIRTQLHNSRVRRSLITILDRNVLASFATVRPSGQAYANTAYFAFGGDFSLYWYSYPDSQHSRNLRAGPSMAVTIFDSHQTWGGFDRGLQLFGLATELEGDASERAERLYAGRYPRFKEWKSGVVRESGRFELRPYRFRPRRIVVFDERALGEGKFWEITLPTRRLRERNQVRPSRRTP